MLKLKNSDFLISMAVIWMRAITLACKLGLAIFIGRYLDLPSLGIYGLAAGAITIGPVLVGLGLVHVIMREAVLLPRATLTGHLRDYWLFTVSIYVLALALTVCATIVLDLTWLPALVVAIALFEHLGNDVFQLFSNLEKPFSANINAFLRGGAWILVYVAIALWNPAFRTLEIMLVFWLAGTALAFACFVWSVRGWPWKEALARPFGTKWIKNTIGNAFVVYLSDLSFVASQQLDRYLVTAFLGLRLAGIYFLYWSAANAVSLFVSMAVLQLHRPRLIKAFSNGGVRVHRVLVNSTMKTTIVASIALSIIVAGAFYLVQPLLRQPAVGDYLGALLLVMAGMAVRNVADVGAMALFTSRRDGIMTLTNFVAVLLLVIFQLLLLPVAGLYGAGAAILVAFGIIVAWRYTLLFGKVEPDRPIADPSHAAPAKPDCAKIPVRQSQIDC